VLSDLLPVGTYFRFNPTLSENIPLDENREEKLDMMQKDTVTYLKNNEILLQWAASQLLLPRQRSRKVLDWVTLKKSMHGID
jgi:calcium-independent phospholipase A2-gamma